MTNAHSRFVAIPGTATARRIDLRIVAVITAFVSIALYISFPFEKPRGIENTVAAIEAFENEYGGKQPPGGKKTGPSTVTPYKETTTTTLTTTTTTTTTTTAILTTALQIIQKKDKKIVPETVPTYVEQAITTAAETTILQKKDKTSPASVPTYTEATTTITSVVPKDKKTTPESVPVYTEATTTVTSIVQKNKKTAPESVPVYTEATTEASIVQKDKKETPKQVPEYVSNYDQGRTPDYDQGRTPEYDQGSVVEEIPGNSEIGNYPLRIYMTEDTDWIQLTMNNADAKRLANFNGKDQNSKATAGEYKVPEGMKLKVEANLYFTDTLYSVVSDEALQQTLFQHNGCDANTYASPLKVPAETAVFFNKNSAVSYNSVKDVVSKDIKAVPVNEQVQENGEAQVQKPAPPVVPAGPKEFCWDAYTENFNPADVGFAVGTDTEFIYSFNAATLFPTDCIGKPAFISRFLWNLENRVDVNTGEQHCLEEIVEVNEVAAQHLKNSTVMNSESGWQCGSKCELKQACFYSISYSDNTGYEIAAYYNKLWFGEDDKEFLTNYFGRKYSGKGRYGSQTAQRMLQEAQYTVNYLKSGSPYANMLKDWMSSDWSYYQAYISYYAESFSDYEYVGRKIGWWDGQQTEMIILCDEDGNWTIVVAMTLQNGDDILPRIGEAIVEYHKFELVQEQEDDDPNENKDVPMDWDGIDDPIEETPFETSADEAFTA